MLRHKILALALGLTLAGVGLRADDARLEAKPDVPVAQQAPPAGETPQVPPTNQPGISVNPPGREQPVTAPTTPAPEAPAVPLTPTDAPPAQQPDAPKADPPRPAQPIPTDAQQPPQPEPAPAPVPDQPAPAEPQPVQPDQPVPAEPQPAQPDQPAPTPPQPVVPEPQQPAQQAPDQPAPAPEAEAQIDTEGLPVNLNSLQEFVSHQDHEIGMLSRQMDVLKAANRPEAVMAFYHMIRDHTLVSDAAQNVLARRQEISRPFPVRMDEPMAQTPEEIIRQQAQHHEQELAKTREMLENASTPEEKSILQQAAIATSKHLNWLRAMDQGQPVRIGFFTPTMPLSRIAGYREQSTVRQPNRSDSRTRARRARRGR